MPPGKRKGPSSSSSKRGRSELDKLAAASDSDNEDGLLQLHDGTAAADSDELGGFDEEAVYGLDDDDSDEDKDEGESEDDEEDDEDVLEEALLRGGKQAQRECLGVWSRCCRRYESDCSRTWLHRMVLLLSLCCHASDCKPLLRLACTVAAFTHSPSPTPRHPFHPPDTTITSINTVAKQAQYLQQKLKLQQREDESDEDEEGGDDDEQQQQRGEQTLGDKLWGANKRAYYQTEDAEVCGCVCVEGGL